MNRFWGDLGVGEVVADVGGCAREVSGSRVDDAVGVGDGMEVEERCWVGCCEGKGKEEEKDWEMHFDFRREREDGKGYEKREEWGSYICEELGQLMKAV